MSEEERDKAGENEGEREGEKMSEEEMKEGEQLYLAD